MTSNEKAKTLCVRTWGGRVLVSGFTTLYISAVDEKNDVVGKRVEVSVKEGKLLIQEIC